MCSYPSSFCILLCDQDVELLAYEDMVLSWNNKSYKLLGVCPEVKSEGGSYGLGFRRGVLGNHTAGMGARGRRLKS